MKTLESLDDDTAIKLALTCGRNGTHDGKFGIPGSTTALNLEVENGYESDCLSIDEYIEDGDFFRESEFPKKRVVSALSAAANAFYTRKKTVRSTNKVKITPYRYSELEKVGLEMKRKYFAEVIDKHVLTIERYSGSSKPE